MDKRSPYFSVIIPTYNRAGLIGETVQSILQQELGDFEILIIDDGSTDETRQVIEAIDDERIRYFYKENGERGAARNYGMNRATGQFMVFFDSDDLMHPDHLSTLQTLIHDNPGFSLYATKHQFLRDGQVIDAPGLKDLSSGAYGKDLIIRGNPLSCHFCVKRNTEKVHLFQEDRSYATMEDWIFLAENLFNHQLLLGDSVTISMRDHAERSMRADHRRVIDTRLKAKDLLESRCPWTARERKELEHYSHYFCAVHCYLGNYRREGFGFLIRIVGAPRLTLKVLALAVKTMIGQGVVRQLPKIK